MDTKSEIRISKSETNWKLQYRNPKLDELLKSRDPIEFVIPAKAGSGPGQAPESRVPGENRDPVFEMVPDFRRDDVWTPASAGVTLQESFYEIIKLHLFEKFEFRKFDIVSNFVLRYSNLCAAVVRPILSVYRLLPPSRRIPGRRPGAG
jgi:hypothetical protein